ncbi:MAG: Zn-ribbon domain-containing OB-fold protein [Alicyclobacillus macrosporangiidus]|uniref:Zn-ribbon domain-containing OB-fold protein n=1 Tax=Alicyclobacillus macrosporangiidus TaxID=392015 RepID=UPI0026F0E96F|nr:Zn-ribbon domain-containing OB-fold protein [Alicyclobacillus macrosporangiidus]MCL6600184.1 Zn-ribbon domain-containing OB-fold protein [Alicyclobacillus macrosporangiidus]
MQRPLPSKLPEARPYWDGIDHGELRLQKCKRCGRLSSVPQLVCPQDGSTGFEWVKASGKGVVHTFTVNPAHPHLAFQAECPYVIAIVRLAEGVYCYTRINVPPDQVQRVRIGMPVRAVFVNVSPDQKLVYFEPDAGEV